jgi:uncharacterized protein YbaP (TraB family)
MIMKHQRWNKKIQTPSLIVFILFQLLAGYSFPADPGKSFLWLLEAEKGKCYVLGSIHMLMKEHYPLAEKIEQAYQKSGILAVEADISADKLGWTALLMKRGLYEGEETLADNVSKETFDRARKKLKEYGMDIEGFKKFKPWFLAFTITGVDLMKLGFDPNYGVDKYFIDKAVKKKPIVELEGIAYQIEVMESFNDKEQEKFLLYTIAESSSTKANVEKIVAAWAAGDTGGLSSLIKENMAKYPDLSSIYEKIMDSRNVAMTEKIMDYLQSGEVHFIVVGAAHLVGRTGILQLLRERGVKIEQL